MENEFYLRDTRSNVGSTCMFWAIDAKGYVSDLDKAQVFNRKEAQKYADRQCHFIPLSKSKVDAVATTRVDMQYLNGNQYEDSQYIIQLNTSRYDGNDIYFDDGSGEATLNYDEAAVFSANDVLSKTGVNIALFSKEFIDSISRRTVQAENINHRKMITAAGVKYRAPRKRRETAGKERGNCPCCGKITWSYNPYEPDFCNRDCEREGSKW